mmetsp:Transcript_81229/g.220123  ORF Transcript_81229/g.220123 Transcript_81229/m.220123 type:complete len:326 (-) Transcript_81229:151-1128(-)
MARHPKSTLPKGATQAAFELPVVAGDIDATAAPGLTCVDSLADNLLFRQGQILGRFITFVRPAHVHREPPAALAAALPIAACCGAPAGPRRRGKQRPGHLARREGASQLQKRGVWPSKALAEKAALDRMPRWQANFRRRHARCTLEVLDIVVGNRFLQVLWREPRQSWLREELVPHVAVAIPTVQKTLIRPIDEQRAPALCTLLNQAEARDEHAADAGGVHGPPAEHPPRRARQGPRDAERPAVDGIRVEGPADRLPGSLEAVDEALHQGTIGRVGHGAELLRLAVGEFDSLPPGLADLPGRQTSCGQGRGIPRVHRRECPAPLQ